MPALPSVEVPIHTPVALEGAGLLPGLHGREVAPVSSQLLQLLVIARPQEMAAIQAHTRTAHIGADRPAGHPAATLDQECDRCLPVPVDCDLGARGDVRTPAERTTHGFPPIGARKVGQDVDHRNHAAGAMLALSVPSRKSGSPDEALRLTAVLHRTKALRRSWAASAGIERNRLDRSPHAGQQAIAGPASVVGVSRQFLQQGPILQRCP